MSQSCRRTLLGLSPLNRAGGVADAVPRPRPAGGMTYVTWLGHTSQLPNRRLLCSNSHFLAFGSVERGLQPLPINLLQLAFGNLDCAFGSSRPRQKYSGM